MEGFFFPEMERFLGQTVTVFTESGGLSGSGFTGVLISYDNCVIRLLCDIGAPPACPVGSSCTNYMTPCGMNNGQCCQNFCMNPFGAVAVIPVRAIAAFVHHAI